MEKAFGDLCDAQSSAISPPRRFQCAYDAARESVLIYAGARNLPIPYGDWRHLEAFRALLVALDLSQDVLDATERLVDHHYRETQLFYCGQTSINAELALQALSWAKQLQSAVLESL